MTSRIVFVTGGARSGKSSYAEKIAREQSGTVMYLATAQAFDTEMKERIDRHRSERPLHWQTFEEPLDIVPLLEKSDSETLLLDCLSLWVSNMILADWPEDTVLTAADRLLQAARKRTGLTILVTNEVGLGIVPDNALARRYRDVLGWVNQRCAAEADEAYLLVSGLPLKLKPT